MKTQFYSKKPDSVEAIQWDGKNTDDVVKLATGLEIIQGADTSKLPIQTATGLKEANVGDYFVKDEQGNVNIVSEADFKNDYEATTRKPKSKEDDKVSQGSNIEVGSAPPPVDQGSLATKESDTVTQPNDSTPNTKPKSTKAEKK